MKKQTGQVALVVLIISAIALTVGMALSDRVRTNIKVDKDDELLQRAFNAAESGVDRYLADDATTNYTAPDGSTAELNVSDITGTTVEFGEYTRKDDYAFFWLVDRNSDGSINYTNFYNPANPVSICFDNFNGSLLVYYYGMNADYGVIRRVYNLNGATNTVNNGLATGQTANVCAEYGLGMNFDLSGFTTPLLLVVKPVGGGSKFALRGSSSLPIQGQLISATGRSADVSTNVSMIRRWDPAYYMFFMLDGVVSRGSIE